MGPPRAQERRGSRLVLAAALAGILASVAAAQGERGSRPDQILWRNSRGQVNNVTGVIVENTLAKTVVELPNGETVEQPSDAVERVVLGDVTTTFQDGRAYADRGDHENAAAMFRLVAGDGNVRPVVRAAARLEAGRSLLLGGAQNPDSFTEAKAELERFLEEYPDHRDVPRGRFLLGRATRLASDPAAAAETLRSLFKEAAGDSPPDGYSLTLCYSAGLEAAGASLDAGDTRAASDLFAELEALLPRALAEVSEDDPSRAELARIQSAARLGEGFVLLAQDKGSQAKTFFEGQLSAADPRDSALRFGSRLGLAEAYQQEGKLREAQLEFAFVAAIDYTDHDRVARALIGLAECALALQDSSAKKDAKIWLQTVRDLYPDTPSVLRALKLSQTQ